MDVDGNASGGADPGGGYFGLRRAEPVAHSREAILVAAIEVIADRGLESTRLTDISDACGVPPDYLVDQFRSLEGLVRAAFQHLAFYELGEIAGAMRVGDDPWDQLRTLMEIATAENEGFENVWRGWVEFWRAAIRDVRIREQADEGYQQWRGLVEQIVRRGVEQGRFSTSLDPAVVALQISALVDGIAVPVVIRDSGARSLPVPISEVLVSGVAQIVGLQPH